MLTYQIKDIYNEQLVKKDAVSSNVLVTHQQKNQRLGIETRRSRVRRTRHMTEIMNLARKNLAAGKVIKVGTQTKTVKAG